MEGDFQPLNIADSYYKAFYGGNVLYSVGWTQIASFIFAASGNTFPAISYDFGSASAFLIRPDTLP